MNNTDYTDQTFFKLRVVGRSQLKNNSGGQYWNCLCECGKTTLVTGGNLLSGTVMSCGCWGREVVKLVNTTHGKSRTSEHNIWKSIKQRTTNKNCSDYPAYGGKGITMSDEWRDSFSNFFRDMGPKPSPKHSIDRIENSKGYTIDNCKWSTPQEQAENKTTTKKYYFNGCDMTMTQIAAMSGVSYEALRRRLAKGESLERALISIKESPTQKHSRKEAT